MALAESQVPVLELTEIRQEEASGIAQVGGPNRAAPGKIIAEAIDYINRHGWGQGQLYKNDEVCLMGALHKYGSVPSDVYVRLAMKLDLPVTSTFQEVFKAASTWNDTPGRTQEEVIELLSTL